MPDKHPNTERWGGPGASHEDRTKPQPEYHDPREGGPTNPRVSMVSGGGGERDIKHSHDDKQRSTKASKGQSDHADREDHHQH